MSTSHYYGIPYPGGSLGDVVKSTSTTGKTLELLVVDGVTDNNRVEILKAIEALVSFITTDNAPA